MKTGNKSTKNQHKVLRRKYADVSHSSRKPCPHKKRKHPEAVYLERMEDQFA